MVCGVNTRATVPAIQRHVVRIVTKTTDRNTFPSTRITADTKITISYKRSSSLVHNACCGVSCGSCS